MASPTVDPQIVQATGDFHHLIRESILGIAQHVFHNATALDAGQGVLDTHPQAREFAVGTLLGLRQCALRWLFFAMYVRATLGS